ncbi:MAG: Polysaccharide pyruvyl transferase [Lentisphaerae bacterium ADurb.Bin082]|nr:MAG: Polysaccharide pyruvyl transferase [Lentisphaerae bacterium ADurb.Bin082]
MKIGVLTLLEQLNYGGVLQAFALQEVLNEQGYQAEVIRFWHSPGNVFLYGRLRQKGYNRLRRLLRLAYYSLKRNYMLSDDSRRRRTINFIENTIKHSTREYRSYEELTELSRDYDTIIVGSDQVWNPNLEESRYYLLDGILENINKIAYAVSFGTTYFPEECRRQYKRPLSKFKAISCRECSGCEFVNSLLGNDASLWVVDPVLLLAKEKWWSMARYSGKAENYTLCYWLGDLTDLSNILNSLPDTQRVYVCLNGMEQDELISGHLTQQIDELKLSERAKLCLGGGPLDFIRLMAHADSIISDSFHAMIFSYIFEKKVSIYLASCGIRKAMRGRMIEFANRCKMQDCISADISLNEPVCLPDYTRCAKFVEDWRRDSLEWLRKALDN